MQDLLTVVMVAKHLSVSRKRVYQLIEQGKLDSLRLSARTLRVTRDSLQRLITDQLRAEKRKLGLDIGDLPKRPRMDGVR